MAKPIPLIRHPAAGYIRVECSVDCASCGRRQKLLDDTAIWGLRTLEMAVRELGWKCIRLRWFCPLCVTGETNG